MPAEEFDGGTFVGITVISVGILFAGYLGYKKRDLRENN